MPLYPVRQEGGRKEKEEVNVIIPLLKTIGLCMKKNRLVQADALIAQGRTKKLIRIGDDGKRIEYLRHGISRDWTKPEASVGEDARGKRGVGLGKLGNAEFLQHHVVVPVKEVVNGRLDAYYYKSSFKELGKELTRCNSVPFGNLITEIYNGIDCRDYQDEGVPYLKVANVKPGEFSFDDLKYIDRKEIGVKDIALKAGRMLLTRKGTFGNAIALGEDYDYAISSEVFCLSIRNELVDVHYLETVINSSIGRMLCDKYKIGAIMGSLSQEAVKALPIPLPEANIQRRIASNAASIRAEACKLKSDATAALNTAKRKIEARIVGR